MITAVPTVYPDEIGYLMNAAAIAGYQSDIATQYYSGYSLLISPAYFFGDSAESVYFYVKAMNTAFFIGVFVVAFRLVVRLMPSTPRMEVLLAVLVVSLYPPFLVYNSLALSESAYVFFFVLSAYLLSRLESWSYLGWVALALCLGVLFSIHPKSAPVLMSAILVCAYLAMKGHGWAKFLLLISVIALSMVFTAGLNAYVKAALTLSTESITRDYPVITSLLLERLFSWPGIVNSLNNLVGQTLYLVVVTLGAVVFGFLTAARAIRTKDDHSYVWAYLLLSLVGTVFMSATFLGSVRLDHVLYGRYNEGVLAPLLAVGFLSVPKKLRPWVLIAVAVALLAYLNYLGRLWYPKEVTGYLNIPALYYLRFVKLDIGIFHPGVIFAVFSALITIWLLASRVTSIRLSALALGVYIFTAAAYGADLLYVYSHGRQMATNDISEYVNDNLQPEECVNYDMGFQDYRKFWLYPFRMYKNPVMRVRLDRPESFCSPWVITNRPSMSEDFPGAVLVVEEEYAGGALWRLSQESLSASQID